MNTADQLKRIKELLGAVTGFEDDDQQYVDDARDAVQKLIEALAEQPAQQKPVTPCTQPSLGACSLREDGTASRWNCVMCGTEFVPKATNRWAEFNEATKRNMEHSEWYLSTHPQPAQQQIASTITITQRGSTRTIDNHFEDCVRDWPDGEYKLYTTPPAQRTWVGLTDEEANKIYKDGSTFGEMMRMVEAKLKEKNT